MAKDPVAVPCSRAAFKQLMASVPPGLSALLASGTTWFWTTDSNHRFSGLSDEFFRLTGADPAGYIGRSRMDFIVGLAAYTPEGEAHLRCLRDHRPFQEFTYRHSFSDGRKGWISTSGTPVFDENGRFCGYHGTAIMISGALEQAGTSLNSERELLARSAELQRHVEARTDALDQSYRLLSEVLESMDQGLLVYDVTKDGTMDIVLSNARFCSLMQLPRNLGQAGRTLTEVMDFCDARNDFDHLPGGRPDLRNVITRELPILLKPGDGTRTVLFHTVRRSTTGAVVTLTDVTPMEKRKNALEVAQRTAQDANHLLTEVLEAMGEGLLVTSGTRLSDGDNRVLMVNPAYRALFDLEPEDIPYGMPMKDYIALLVARGDQQPDQDFDAVDRLLNAGEQVTIHIPSNGRSYCLRATKRPSGGFVLVHTDVTDLCAHNALLERARQEADRASAAKSEFLASMSHEIRTPMNGIIGMAELLAESPLNEDQQLFARTIHDSGMALSEVIGDILDFSKIEAGKMTLSTGPVDLVTLASDVRLLLSPRANQADIDLRLDCGADFPPLWVGDGTRLRQILINLVGNAIKFTHRGHICIGLERIPSGGIELSVRDTGIGIPEDRLASIFEAFEQVQDDDGAHYSGTGLGLEITRRLVELMGGTLCATSEVGRGSVFTAVLPLCVADPVASRDAVLDPAAGASPGGMAQCRILVAEDNRTNQLVLRHMLAPLGAKLTFCQDGVEVVEAFCAGGADLVLMDISMPRKSGIEATRDIRAHENASSAMPSPIIALTGNATSHDQIRCLEAGMNGFLTKPLNKASLLAEIARVLPDRPIALNRAGAA